MCSDVVFDESGDGVFDFATGFVADSEFGFGFSGASILESVAVFAVDLEADSAVWWFFDEEVSESAVFSYDAPAAVLDEAFVVVLSA